MRLRTAIARARQCPKAGTLPSRGGAAVGPQHRQCPGRGADRRLPAGIVAVEAQDRRWIEAPQPLELAFGKRSPVGRDHFGYAGAVERDHVHVPFDDDQPFRGAAGRPGAVEVVKRPPFVEEDSLRGIQVLGLAFAEDPPAEADDSAARVADRDHQPPAEAVVAFLLSLLGLDQHPGVDELVLAELLAERTLERRAVVGRQAEPEPLRNFCVDPAAREVIAGLCTRKPIELLGKPLADFGHDVGQRGGALGLFLRSRVRGRDLHARFRRQLFHRVHEHHSALIGEESDGVAVGPAAEAVEKALLVIHREAWRMFVVKWTAGLPLPPRPHQFHRRRDDRAEHGPSAQFVEPLR